MSAVRSSLRAWFLAAVLPSPSTAFSQIISADAFTLSGDLRAVASEGEKSWLNEGFGKLRAGGSGTGDLRVKPEFGSIDLVWQPRLGFAWSATVAATIQGGERLEGGLSEAFVSYKPLRGEKLRLSARAGLMWPPISLEHGGGDWHVLDTVTPSAINSWVGEEVRPLALEGIASTDLSGHELTATAGLMAANDTAGTLIALRGWALHDRKTLASHRQPLPRLVDMLVCCQPQYTTPLLDVDKGFAKRPGYYAKLAWRLPVPLRLELFHYDNRADPEAVNQDLEWGWRTRFNNLGVVGRVAPSVELKAQAMEGSTRMGFYESGRIWVDTDFKSAFLMATHRAGESHISLRAEMFSTDNEGSFVAQESDERGRAFTAAYRREINSNLSALVELLHVRSRRDQREFSGVDATQNQSQLQFVARARW